MIYGTKNLPFLFRIFWSRVEKKNIWKSIESRTTESPCSFRQWSFNDKWFQIQEVEIMWSSSPYVIIYTFFHRFPKSKWFSRTDVRVFIYKHNKVHSSRTYYHNSYHQPKHFRHFSLKNRVMFVFISLERHTPTSH